ncbi:MAG: hypothetical protein WCW52_09145 [Elusimicrobiales bacterium]|jgi:hypothetical protein
MRSQFGLIPVGWTIDSLDWSTKDPDTLYRKTMALIQQRGKGIVLMHDIHPQSRTASKQLVKWLADHGYKVVSPERMAEAYNKQIAPASFKTADFLGGFVMAGCREGILKGRFRKFLSF